MDDSTARKRNRPTSRQSIAHIPSTSGPLDKDNITADVSAMQRSRALAPQMEKKKSRSKSLGPGGLEALKESAGNVVKPSLSLPKSILKPAIPLTPPKAIPAFDETRKRSTGKSKAKSPTRNGVEDLLIDFSTPAPNANSGPYPIAMAGSENVLDPFSPIARSKSPRGKTVAVRTEEEQEATAREREAEEKRQSQKQAALEQRAARRKSMANRRVSFAPEATLHTWNIELAEDSTTSSASNSTRRQSSMTAAQSPLKNAQSPGPDTEVTEAPSTPPEQIEEPLVQASPAHQRDVRQKKHRRSSSGVQSEENVSQEVFSSSPFRDSEVVEAESSPIRVEDSIHSDDDDDDTDADGDTAMSLNEGTSHTMASDNSSSSQSSLDERLRRAATQAGTRGIDYDENGDDLSMELATGTVTSAFQPWAKRGAQEPVEDLSAMQDQENVNPFSPAFEAQNLANQAADLAQEDETQDMSMDVTTALGGILAKRSPGKSRRKSIAPSRRRSSVARRRSSEDDSVTGEEAMDFTSMGGGILETVPQSQNALGGVDSTKISDEDMSMEFTNVIGGVLNNYQSELMDDNETMEMTMAVGGILPPIEERTEPQTDAEDEQTVGMEMTVASGAILPPHLTSSSKLRAKQLMEEETDAGQLSESPPYVAPVALPVSPPRMPSAVPEHVATSVASETGSPSLALKPRLSGRNNGTMPHQSTTPRSSSRHATPLKHTLTAQQSTPTKQVTPLPNRASTPNKTPIASNVTHRGASPKKLFKAEIRAKASPASVRKSASKPGKGLFDKNEQTGQQTPSVVLHAPKPHQHLRRRSSGLGMDQAGLGSPRIAELLDRRESIGEVAVAFVPQMQENRVLRFEDPRAMEDEIDAEREEEERRESGRFIMEQEADEPLPQEENATLQLKDLIESMTPKKNKTSKLRGRKSLHVGAAKGVLGKRPAELDLDDDEDDADTTPKRLKAVSREASPVKQVHLPRPPSKDETTGRLTRGKRRSLEEAGGISDITPTLSQSPSKVWTASTPQAKGRYKDLPAGFASKRPTSFEDKLDNVLDAVDVSTAQSHNNDPRAEEEEKIPLQTFLNMTNIHFIELSTTKRRHTAAPATLSRPSQDGQPASIESCFASAATTLPLLELYQHATRELKSYISSGRRIIRSIEAETLEEQPALFREYVDARPDVKMVMDNQFRNGKANARLQSKEGWYAWRTQLVEGLRGGLVGIKKGMEEDALRLSGQEQMLEGVVPGLTQKYEELTQEAELLALRTTELDGPDQEVLRDARANLKLIDAEVKQKEALLEQLQQQIRDKDDALSSAAELKEEFQSQIEEAERVREECRGWSPIQVLELKTRVEAIEKKTGWVLVTAEEETEEPDEFGVALTMRFQAALRLFFYPSAFLSASSRKESKRRSNGRRSKSDSGASAPISLTYSPVDEDGLSTSATLPTEKRFFLQLLQSQLHAFAAMPKGTVSAKMLLSAVSNAWKTAHQVSEEIRMLNMAGITSVSILGDDKFGTKTMILVSGRGRVDVQAILHASIGPDGNIYTSSSIAAKAVYGEAMDLLSGARSAKVHQALMKEVKSKELGEGAWVSAVRGLEAWIAAQPKKEKSKTKEKEKERAPLSPKKVAPVQRKAQLPVPVAQAKAAQAPVMASEPVVKVHTQKVREAPSEEKENFPSPGPPVDPEWTPTTPIKRIGALRRSPIAG